MAPLRANTVNIGVGSADIGDESYFHHVIRNLRYRRGTEPSSSLLQQWQYPILCVSFHSPELD
jgi:hypothetical protein